MFVLIVCLCTQLGSGRAPHTLPDDCPRAFALGLVGHRLSHVPSSWRYTSSGCWHEYTLTISPLVLSHRWSGCTMTGHGVCVLSVINHLTTVIVPMMVSRVIVPQNKVRIMVRVFTCLFSFGLCVLFALFVCVRTPSGQGTSYLALWVSSTRRDDQGRALACPAPCDQLWILLYVFVAYTRRRVRALSSSPFHSGIPAPFPIALQVFARHLRTSALSFGIR